MKKTRLRMLAVVMITIATTGVINAQNTGGVTVNNTSCPSSGSEYAGQVEVNFTDGVNHFKLANPVHGGFSASTPLSVPGSGGTVFSSFGSDVYATLTANGAVIKGHLGGQVVVRATDVSVVSGGNTGVYQTEMLQMNLTGSTTLPAGIMVRESPTLQSTGLTTVTPLPGGL